jgi:hypothetical protein
MSLRFDSIPMARLSATRIPVGTGARAFIRATDPVYEAIVNFRPLAPFGNHDCYISYPGWYGELCGKFSESGPLLAPGGGGPTLRCEYELNRVRVLVQLHRKLTKDAADELANALRNWFLEVGSKGVFAEGGMTSISSVLRYQSKDATFDVDASHSGAHTLVTLVLAILDWALDCRRAINLVTFVAGRPQFYEWDDGPRKYEELLRSPLSVPLI